MYQRAYVECRELASVGIECVVVVLHELLYAFVRLGCVYVVVVGSKHTRDALEVYQELVDDPRGDLLRLLYAAIAYAPAILLSCADSVEYRCGWDWSLSKKGVKKAEYVFCWCSRTVDNAALCAQADGPSGLVGDVELRLLSLMPKVEDK